MEITPELLIRAYRAGFFPMAEARDADRLYWLDPEQRGILPLDGFHLPRRLLRTVESGSFTVTADRDFAGVIAGCAQPAPGREDTWINPQIEALFTELHRRGVAHSVESWQGGQLVGGLYGVALGGAFFGESMFSRATDASKVALVHLVARLPMGDGQRLTLDLLRKTGLGDSGPVRAWGWSATWDWRQWFVRAAWDPKQNFGAADVLRLSTGLRF